MTKGAIPSLLEYQYLGHLKRSVSSNLTQLPRSHMTPSFSRLQTDIDLAPVSPRSHIAIRCTKTVNCLIERPSIFHQTRRGGAQCPRAGGGRSGHCRRRNGEDRSGGGAESGLETRPVAKGRPALRRRDKPGPGQREEAWGALPYAGPKSDAGSLQQQLQRPQRGDDIGRRILRLQTTRRRPGVSSSKGPNDCDRALP